MLNKDELELLDIALHEVQCEACPFYKTEYEDECNGECYEIYRKIKRNINKPMEIMP